MGRSSSTGLPFLVLRPDAGQYTCQRSIPGDIAALVTGTVELL
ncbi:hypothetical protein [Lichenifustis flavocetrariae]|nr:hypothetical protein [Lichenifustis flavocetrariae]